MPETAASPVESAGKILALGQDLLGEKPVQFIVIYPDAAYLALAIDESPLADRITAVEEILASLKEEAEAEAARDAE